MRGRPADERKFITKFVMFFLSKTAKRKHATNPAIVVPLVQIVTNVEDALLMNLFEITVWSFFLMRLESQWVNISQAQNQLKVLFFTAFAVKVNFTEDYQIFTPYLNSHYPNFSESFKRWLYSKPVVRLGIAPVELCKRFSLFQMSFLQ